MTRNIASLTSYPMRLPYIAPCLESIFNQSIPLDKVLLYLSEEEITAKHNLIQQLERDFPALEIVFVKQNIKSHKKWFYSFQQHSDDNIILFDDDLLYPPDVVENLLEYHKLFPQYVISRRSHLITKALDNKISKYLDWVFEAPKTNPQLIGNPRFDLFATTGAGTLFPKHFIENVPSELLDTENIMIMCPDADDLWLKFIQLQTNTPVVSSTTNQQVKEISNSQTQRLADYNKHNSGNDIQLQQSRSFIETILGKTLEEACFEN